MAPLITGSENRGSDTRNSSSGVSSSGISLTGSVSALVSLMAAAGLTLAFALNATAQSANEAIPEPGEQAPIRDVRVVPQPKPEVAPADMASDISENDTPKVQSIAQGETPAVSESVGGSDLVGGLDSGQMAGYGGDRRILLGIDRAQVLRLSAAANTIIIGNPTIADAAVYDQNTLILTGKTFGETNLIVIDALGTIIEQAALQVGSPNDVVVVNRGIAQSTYSCAPKCAQTLRIGDSQERFNQTLEQVQSVIQLATPQNN